jgi:hypothetical protein
LNAPTTAPAPTDRATAWLRRRLGRAVLLSYACAVFVPGPGLWLRHTHALPLGPLIHLPVSTAPCLLSLVLFSAGLQVPARSLAMTRLITARLLEHATTGEGGGVDGQLAAGLVASARYRHTAAEAWHHIVDLDDPTAHPALPPYDYVTRRRGLASRLARPSAPHPVCDIAAITVLRAGRLLYGPDWTPLTGSRIPPERPPAELREAIGGVGRLLHTLYRLSAAGRFLASATPTVVERAAGGLVTDSIEHCPPHLPATVRFYPVLYRQTEQIAACHRAAGAAEKALCTGFVDQCRVSGEPITREGLDQEIAELYLPDVAAFSPRQEAVLQRIMEDHERRMTGFTAAVRQRVHGAGHPPRDQSQEAPVQRGLHP